MPSDLLKGTLGYLQQLASQDADDLPGARLEAQATYLLTTSGHNTGRKCRDAR